VTSLVRDGLSRARPLALQAHKANKAAEREGAIAILPGEREATERLRHLLGLPAADLPSRGGLLVYPAVPGADLAGAAAELAERKRLDGGALAILIGKRAERQRMERTFLEVESLEMGDITHVASLYGPGARQAVLAVIQSLGDDAVAAGRLNPSLRERIADHLIERAARRAGAVGVVPFLPGADMPVITVIQARLVADLATLYERPGGVERVAQLGAVFAAAFGWRALARQVVRLVPGPSFLLAGGIGYSATKATGEAARRMFAAGEDLPAVVQKLSGLVKRAG
jgi:uncharacterized protein (DUF697 family)